MNTPTKEQFLHVIEVLETALAHKPKGCETVNMIEGNVPTISEHACGAPACHAGEYLIGKALLGESKIHPRYSKGATRLANDLGFKSADNLLYWSSVRNWGNQHGDSMFILSKAFGIRGRAATLPEIIHHWKKVTNIHYPNTFQL